MNVSPDQAYLVGEAPPPPTPTRARSTSMRIPTVDDRGNELRAGLWAFCASWPTQPSTPRGVDAELVQTLDRFAARFGWNDLEREVLRHQAARAPGNGSVAIGSRIAAIETADGFVFVRGGRKR